MESKVTHYVYIKRWLEEGKIKKYPFKIYSPVNSKTGKASISLLEAVCQVDSNAYLCELSAGRLHNMLLPEDKSIYLASSFRFREVTYMDLHIKYRRAKVKKDLISQGLMTYTSYTRSLVDIVNVLPKHLDFKEMHDFSKSLKTIESLELLKILEAINNRSLNQRMGWLIDHDFIKLDDPYLILKYCRAHKSKNRIILCKDTSKAYYERKWQIYVNYQH